MENLELFEKAPNETVREYAYRVLYENIMSLKLPPGTAMSEQELSGILNVSRTPVREAFIRLSQKGLLEILPQRGTFVSKIHTEQLAEFRFFRVTLERAIIELACQAFPEFRCSVQVVSPNTSYPNLFANPIHWDADTCPVQAK